MLNWFDSNKIMSFNVIDKKLLKRYRLSSGSLSGSPSDLLSNSSDELDSKSLLISPLYSFLFHICSIAKVSVDNTFGSL